MDSFELAHSIRYSDDIKLRTINHNSERIKFYETDLALNSIKISREITPKIYESLQSACNSLKLDLDKVRAYVTSSPEIQASCVSFNKNACILTLTSKIINLLNSEEIKFVIGHELGHFLLSHNIEEQLDYKSKESFLKKRSQEISVDRIGLWACGDINIAIRAIIKSLSGLSEDFIVFDVKSLLKQLNTDVSRKQISEQFSTHPSFILRLKALLRFSECDAFQKHTKNVAGKDLKKIDKNIREEFDIYIDKELRENILNLKNNLSFWGHAYAFISDGTFSVESQKLMKKKFDEKRVIKLMNMIESLEKELVLETLEDKFISSVKKFRKSAPNSAKKEMNLIFEDIGNYSSQNDFLIKVLKII